MISIYIGLVWDDCRGLLTSGGDDAGRIATRNSSNGGDKPHR